MNEQQLNDFLGDNEDKHLGTGWWANVLSAFFGALAFGGVLCLYFPQLLTTPELRAHYPVAMIRLLIQGLIWSSLFFGTIGALLRKKKILALCGLGLAACFCLNHLSETPSGGSYRRALPCSCSAVRSALVCSSNAV